ncbi:aminotransferase class I/II-fold pyridoxal phosphate-dependent enzyme [Peptoniphilus sp. KCTC 25270]|uniref:pyridoxal phosphate-dependent aminotransferase n=1 Tax=Peptoniphilus sp. KCTC 25270 TaxID=2897414 RepID=UPI001E53C28A|nr:histidinol-phosphate transaminase [Peptoniphilus sp. KCTC 25270]MCD1147449.1 aminotransferase class I/II-fold pyridoxal phosphate-dependent enzyme [Peptoniphilus sp. KCTC 25270]
MLYKEKNPHGGDVYQGKITLDFSANTNPFGTPKKVKEAMINAMDEIYQYPDPYCRELVKAIAEWEGIPKDYVLVGNGAADLIYSYCESLSPKKALELAPTFSEYHLALEKNNCEVERFFLKKEKNFLVDRSFVSYLEDSDAEVVFLCNPNNPTGQLIPQRILEELVGVAKERGMFLFVDECFLDLSDYGKSLKFLLKENPHLFLLKAFTKSYGLAGVRLGYGLSSNEELLRKMSRNTQSWNVSTLAQKAGIAALGEGEFLKNTKSYMYREREWMKSQLEQLGYFVCPSHGNFLLFQGDPKLGEQLWEKGISIRNCDNYFGLEPGWYRIGIRLREENKKLLLALQDLS